MVPADGIYDYSDSQEPLEVLLNVYDVAQGDNKNTVVRLNNLVGPGGLGLGGVFHGAIVLGTVEFSFGFCERGTGVYAVKAGKNPMYTFRETVCLGPTDRSLEQIREIIQELKTEWPGASYDLLNRNCCHFCEALAARLNVAPVPGWLNRLASGAAATISMTQDTVKTMHEIGAEMGKLWHRTLAAASQQQQSLAERLQQQAAGIRGLNTPLASSNSSGSTVRSGGGGFALGGIGNGSSSSSNLAGSAAMAGKQLLSGLAQAGHSLRSTTSKLAQAAAARTASNSGPSAQAEDAHGSRSTAEAQQAAAAGQASSAAEYQGLLPGVQPKLSREYRLGSVDSGSITRHDSTGQQQQRQASTRSEGLEQFLSIEDDSDPFIALVGDDDAEDDAQQKAAVQSVLQQHTAVEQQGSLQPQRPTLPAA